MPTPTPKPPPRKDVEPIIRRWLRADVTIDWKDEYRLFYTLFASYPSLTFWQRNELGFRLRSLRWLMGGEGKEKLASDWTVFNYVPPTEPQPTCATPEVSTLEVDTAPVPTYTAPKPRTIADLLNGHQTTSR